MSGKTQAYSIKEKILGQCYLRWWSLAWLTEVGDNTHQLFCQIQYWRVLHAMLCWWATLISSNSIQIPWNRVALVSFIWNLEPGCLRGGFKQKVEKLFRFPQNKAGINLLVGPKVSWKLTALTYVQRKMMNYKLGNITFLKSICWP